jgi:hypothetical protein
LFENQAAEFLLKLGAVRNLRKRMFVSVIGPNNC